MTVIEVQNLAKRYGETVAVRDVSFSVEPGEIFGILGPNGAGKTTTVECIAGLRTPDSGSITVLGSTAGDPALRSRIGVQLQESELQDKITVREALELYSSFYPNPADWRALADDLGLTAKLKSRFGKLSGGQKQRLSIALALIGNPEIAILDELTTGLDPQARRETWELISGIRDRGVTLLLVTHFMEEAERLCDRIVVIDKGAVAALDTPAGLVERTGNEQRIRFRPSTPISDELLTVLPEVRELRRNGPKIEVVGTGNLLHAVVSVLARNGVVAADLTLEQSTLDDAFVHLTGKE
ncbi:ABC transporter ATP-binding protein [Actinoplanes xinjiangensis]|jgi:ABC-2 type transport system ATP-binding protein|uniref:ABC-2 type transport system ATP-binding protein n=1 Tax=Actinoplanes xinjiangensis TaxID=512350 RepID=A0A316G9N1_9ACTN|nr:ABC transporter ATP-binding protein [Actinoplanes xinjiangensis]PWK51197.1 ABC-2 type transport system ATP-binding protein [Actinoplanes xinjiangensis]GIF39820.1 multidrug ABC transporter ATP-binding protein [Actinoplanes xinjiangensis]